MKNIIHEKFFSKIILRNFKKYLKIGFLQKNVCFLKLLTTIQLRRNSSVEECRAHIPEAVGSIPSYSKIN